MASAESKVDAPIHDEERVTGGLNVAIHHPTGWLSWRLIMYMTIIGLSMGLFGYDNSFASPLLQLPLFIKKYQGLSLTFTARNLDLIVTVPLVGAALGTFIAPPLLKRMGRKKTFITAYFLLNLGIGVITTTAPLFLSELVPAHVRGRAIGFCVAGVAAVGVIATTIVWATEKIDDERQYKIPLGIQAALPVILGFLTFLCPESPVWDVQHGKIDLARRTLLDIRNKKTDIVEAELAMHQTAIAIEAERLKQTKFWDILNRANLKRTLTAGALLSASQVGGQVLVSSYATVILVLSGVGNAFQITIIITCLQFLGTVIGPVLVDRVGRRPVALVGFSILCVLDIAAGSLAAAGLTTKSRQLGLAAVFIIFGFFNCVSFQSLCFVVPTEIATPSLREPTVAWSVFWSYTTAVITTFAVPQIVETDNLGAETAFIFAACAFITIIWAYFYLPETKARTLAEVDEMYRIKLPMRKWRYYQCQAMGMTAEKMEGRVSIDEERHV
ncbi:hypothetical protein B7494_g3008 [Chlorociboria aeruginascens]|nr:hypothetical protein B7494_g3008 [Chlorociboria aeruginascens]